MTRELTTRDAARAMMNTSDCIDFNSHKEILFRAKDNNWKWHYGYLLQENYNGTSYCQKILSRGYSQWNETRKEYNTEVSIIPETVCMCCSGFRDKNGTKIFEGDIVELTNSREEYTNENKITKLINPKRKRVGVVLYNYGCFWIRFRDSTSLDFLYSYNCDFLEVVNNIFDDLNPKRAEV